MVFACLVHADLMITQELLVLHRQIHIIKLFIVAKSLSEAQPAVGTDLAFGQGSRRLLSSMALVVY